MSNEKNMIWVQNSQKSKCLCDCEWSTRYYKINVDTWASHSYLGLSKSIATFYPMLLCSLALRF